MLEASTVPAKSPDSAPVPAPGTKDRISGSLVLHSATWKADFLAGPVELSTATLHMDGAGFRWDPVAFAYGPVQGTATLTSPPACDHPEECPLEFTLQFGSLDAAVLQAAMLGARQPGTLLSSLLAHLRPADEVKWPLLRGSIRADELVLGPVTLGNPVANVTVQANQADIAGLDATLFGGRFHATGSFAPGSKPDYKLNGRFENVSASDLGRLLGMTWSGDGIDGTGDVELIGFTDKELSASARGKLHFDWRHGSISETTDVDLPPALVRFDRWTADAEIANGAITLKQNQVQHGIRRIPVEGSAAFGDPPRVTFGSAHDTRAAQRQGTE